MKLLFVDGEFQCLLSDIYTVLRLLSHWDDVHIGDETLANYLESIGVIEWNQTHKDRFNSTDKFQPYFDNFRNTIQAIFK